MKTILILIFLLIAEVLYSQPKPQPDNQYKDFKAYYDTKLSKLIKAELKLPAERIMFFYKDNEYLMVTYDEETFYRCQWRKVPEIVKQELRKNPRYEVR